MARKKRRKTTDAIIEALDSLSINLNNMTMIDSEVRQALAL
jgi:hypothetical protein